MKSKDPLPSRRRALSESRALASFAVGDHIDLRRILVPTDFSDSSRKAIRYALSLAKLFKAEIRLLHVVESIPYPPPTSDFGFAGPYDLRLREDAEKQITQWCEALQEPGVKAEVRFGTPYHEIIEAAKADDIDLIVIATHGRSGFAQLFIGSTAERVVRHASCPVLVVRDKERDFVRYSRKESASTKSSRQRRQSPTDAS